MKILKRNNWSSVQISNSYFQMYNYCQIFKKKGKKAALLPLSYCFCAIPVLSKQQVGLRCCLKFMEEWERLLSCYEYFATCLHFIPAHRYWHKVQLRGFSSSFLHFCISIVLLRTWEWKEKPSRSQMGIFWDFFSFPWLEIYFVFWSWLWSLSPLSRGVSN